MTPEGSSEVRVWAGHRGLIPILGHLLCVALFFWTALLGRVAFPADVLYERWYPWKGLMAEPIRSQNPAMRDPVHQTLPLQVYTWSRIRAGAVPLWNPYVLAGVPHLAAGADGVFYPGNLFYLLLPFGVARNVDLAIHLAVAAIGMHFFVRQLGASALGGFLAGTAFAWSGVFTGWLQFSNVLHTIAWLPTSWYGIERVLVGHSWRWVGILGAVVGLQWLSGAPEFALYNGLAVGIYALVRLAVPSGWRARIRGGAMLGASVIIGAGVGAVQILPLLELMSHTNRAVEGYGELAATGMPMYGVVTALAPFLLGNPADRTFAGPVAYQGTQLYVGFLPLVFLAMGGRALWRRNGALALAAVAVLGVLWAAGSLVLLPLYAAIPPVRSLRYVNRIVFLYAPAAAALAGLGFTTSMSNLAGTQGSDSTTRATSLRGLWWLIAIGGLALGLGMLFQDALVEVGLRVVAAVRGFGVRRAEGLQIARALLPQILHQLLTILGLLAAAAWLLQLGLRGKVSPRIVAIGLASLAAGELLVYSFRYNPMVDLRRFPPFPPLASIGQLVTGEDMFRVATLVKKDPAVPVDQSPPFPPNSLIGYGIQDIGGYLSLVPRRYTEFLSRIVSVDGEKLTNYIWLGGISDRAAVRLLNIKYVLTNPDEQPPFPKIGPPRYTGEVDIYEAAGFLPRAFFVPEARVVRDPEMLLEELARDSFRPDREVLLEEAPPPLPVAAQRECGGGEGALSSRPSVEITRYAPEDVQVSVRTSRPGYLFLGDSYYPGWRATVNGSEVPLYRANYTFRAVGVGCGRQQVQFRFQPWSFRIGLWISLVGFGGVVALVFSRPAWINPAAPRRPKQTVSKE